MSLLDDSPDAVHLHNSRATAKAQRNPAAVAAKPTAPAAAKSSGSSSKPTERATKAPTVSKTVASTSTAADSRDTGSNHRGKGYGHHSGNILMSKHDHRGERHKGKCCGCGSNYRETSDPWKPCHKCHGRLAVLMPNGDVVTYPVPADGDEDEEDEEDIIAEAVDLDGDGIPDALVVEEVEHRHHGGADSKTSAPKSREIQTSSGRKVRVVTAPFAAAKSDRKTGHAAPSDEPASAPAAGRDKGAAHSGSTTAWIQAGGSVTCHVKHNPDNGTYTFTAAK